MSTQGQEISEATKTRLIDMAWLLNDLTSDLKTPVDLLTQLRPQMEALPSNFTSISRLCITSSIVNLCKLNEIITHYGAEINSFPGHIKIPLRNINKEIENRGMYAFRSKYIAHAFSEKKGETKKPLSFDENVKLMMKVVDYGLNPVTENVYKFGEWIHTKDDNSSIVYIVSNTVHYIDKIVGGLGKRR